MQSRLIRYGHDTGDRFTINTPAGAVIFRESKYGSNRAAIDAAMKALDMLRASGVVATIESTVWGWNEQVERARA